METPAVIIEHQLLSQLPRLKRLQVHYYAKCSLGSLEELLVSNGTIGDLPALKTLRTFESEIDYKDNHIDLGTLPQLEDLTIVRHNFKVVVTHSTPRLHLIDITRFESLFWLHSTTKSLRHLVLTNIDDEALPDVPITFNGITFLELHWCWFTTFRKKMRFPSVTHYSESTQIYDNAILAPFGNSSGFLCQLEVLSLRFEYDLRVRRQWQDFSSVYNTLQQMRHPQGALRKCLIQGSVTPPTESCQSWIIYEKRSDPEEERFQESYKTARIDRRLWLLRQIDKESLFRETQEPKRFQEQGPWL